eukprot:CAMPEP_0184753574 /NCGR_PEP_ID=MMETSP0315-20130426/44172_1 /TAXON_ID=101924 /ORGANISM="Rhodosorus marinus, Strain UTEX LB 2760" /LENGTH=78 /DNA_ID=CAMNT_0027232955 /DNA_START=270 /DNA_END=506 /DNA_ORIENTATION=+
MVVTEPQWFWRSSPPMKWLRLAVADEGCDGRNTEVVGCGNMQLDIAGQRMTVRVNVMRYMPRKILRGARFLEETQARH